MTVSARAERNADPWFGDRYGINTYAYSQSHSAVDCLRHLADLGTRAVEMMVYPGHLWIGDGAAERNEIRRVLDASGIRVMSLNAPNIDLNIAAATAEMREMTLRMDRAFLELAADIGAEGIILGPGKANPLFPLRAEVLDGHFFAALDILAPLAEQLGLKLFVENMPFAYLPAAQEVMDRLERYGRDDIEVCYDVANGHFIGEDPVTGLATCTARLGLVHVSDTGRDTFRHDRLGTGTLDLAPLPAAIADTGYAKPVLLEIITANPDPDIAASIAALDAHGF